MRKIILAGLSLLFSAFPVRAAALGIHILHPGEMQEAATLLKTEVNAPAWSYVTIPLSLDDLDKRDEWQQAFNFARQHRLQPLVRLVNRFDAEAGVWGIPTRGDIIDAFAFLDSLTWPASDRYIIAFNEPNHASEWGGTLDPESYARVLDFVTHWAHATNSHYRVLPGAMDLAAANTGETREAFAFLEEMLSAKPHIFDQLDYWNSHSYPNPAFSQPPTQNGPNSLAGFTHELAWLQDKTGLTPRVFITETGWVDNKLTHHRLSDYYAYAYDHVWSDERVVAVTPFVLRGDPGPFAGFSLIDKNGNYTRAYYAYAAQIDKAADHWRTAYQNELKWSANAINDIRDDTKKVFTTDTSPD